MKDNQLRYALTAWKTQSFTGASETLNISQSAISQQIRLLENEIGFKIFERIGNGIKPSYKGSLFLIHADEALSGIDHLSNIAQQLNGQYQNIVSLGFSSNVTEIILQTVTNKVKEVFPASVLKIVTGTTRRIQRMVFQGRLDMGFTFDADNDVVPPNLELKKFVDIELQLGVNPAHRLASEKSPIELSELQNEPLIVNEGDIGLGKLIEKVLQKLDVFPQIVAISDNIHSSIMLVRNGTGVAFLPIIQGNAKALMGGVILKNIKSKIELPIILIKRESFDSELDKTRLRPLHELF